jgi:hypothetical protein
MTVDLPVSTMAMVVLLGPAVVLWAVVEAATLAQRAAGKETPSLGPLTGEKLLTLLRCSSILAGVLFLCYFCEHLMWNQPAEKVVRPEMYWGSFVVLILGSLLTIRKTDCKDFMNREQTEEWKGWMQFLFLQYHYWKMEGAYKDIRVYITCYLWMTGFGNFSFFYVKRDYSLLRVLQMIWRMNFFVVFLCLTMDNPYIVYYICPLHTFYFLVTYATMVLWSEVNHREYAPLVKVITCAALLYTVYDLIPRSFDFFFWWLGNKSTGAPIGAHGVEWEWYFRSFLDHFSSCWGMVFALNMPFLAEWFKKVESFSLAREWGIKGIVGAGLLGMSAAWAANVYTRDKGGYNALHCYYSIVPLLTYLFLRNISKTFRSYYLHGLHWFGTITLESYLLQYHVWLADNAAKLLNIIEGQWLLTFLIASCLHVFLATQVFNITNKLRSLVLPNNLPEALRNLAMLMGGIFASFLVAHGFSRSGLGAGSLCLVVLTVAAGIVGALWVASEVGQRSPKVSEAQTTMSAQVFFGVAFVGCMFATHGMMGYSRVAGATVHLMADERSAAARLTSASGMELSMDKPATIALARQLDHYELLESFVEGRAHAFEIGSLAQPWHGLVAMAALIWCIACRDSFFGLSRLALALLAPEGQKTITWDEAYGPILHKLGIRKPDAEEAGLTGEPPNERTPLTASGGGKEK